MMIKCPICENYSDATASFLPRFNHCVVCGGQFLTELENPVYAAEYFKQKEAPSLISKIVAPILIFFYFLRIKKIKSILKKSSNPKVLDYGCGSDKVVENLIKIGVNAIGFEPSEGARNIVSKKNLPVYGEIKPVEGGYDLIMFWHSLEHIEAPLEIIKNIKNFLSKEGQLLIAAPNANSFEARIFKENWFHYSYPFHRIHFMPKSAKIMLQKAGFKPISIDFWNPEYTISGLVQSFLNWFLPKDTLYSVISHRRQTMPLYNAILISLASILIILIFSPFLALFFIFQLIFCKTGAMVIVAEKI